MKINPRYALIVCTRDRPSQVNDFLTHLLIVNKSPGIVIIVDSSKGLETKQIVDSFKKSSLPQLFYLSSEQGLPHQRNVGIQFIRESNFSELQCITFLDDDCRVSMDYFEVLDAYIAKVEFTGITGNSLSAINRSNFFSRFFQISSKVPGRVLKSGIATPPSSLYSKKTDWMPGLCMNINPNVFAKHTFKDEWQMYYEDVEFSIRVRPPLGFVCLSTLNYSHLEEQRGRLSAKLTALYSDGARWQLSKDFPKVVKKWAVIWSVIGLALSNLWRILRFQDISNNIGNAIGHIVFLKRLVKNQNTMQFRTIKD
jgi:GT2 family glycosyltransferase